MAFDRTGFTKWLKGRGLKAAPDVYPHSLEKIEEMGQLSINNYVPTRTAELLALLEHPGKGRFRDRPQSGLADWQASVSSYDKYMLQRVLPVK